MGIVLKARVRSQDQLYKDRLCLWTDCGYVFEFFESRQCPYVVPKVQVEVGDAL